VLCGDFGAWNVFERQAGLADGGYPTRPIRPALSRISQLISNQPVAMAGARVPVLIFGSGWTGD
jgi:hypothetical protein